MKALIVACAYNEGIKFEMTCDRIAAFFKSRDKSRVQIDALVIDDASDDTAPKTTATKNNFPYLRNEKRSGIGYSIRKGYEFGIQNQYDILITIAGNNKDNPDETDRLIEPIVSGKADFVQGSRYLSGGKYGNMPLYRYLTTKYVHPWLFSLVAGKRITDTTNGFRAVKNTVLLDGRIDLRQDWLDHYELEPYLFCRAIRLGYRIAEVPVTKIYPDKKLGYSKMTPITGWWSILKPLVYLFFNVKK